MSSGGLMGGSWTPDLSEGIPVDSLSILVEDDSPLSSIKKYLEQVLILNEHISRRYEQIEQDLRKSIHDGLNAQIHWMFTDITEDIRVVVLINSTKLVDSLEAQISISLPATVLERLTARSIKTINRTLRRILEQYEPVVKVGTSYVPTKDDPNWVQTIYLLDGAIKRVGQLAPNQEFATSSAHAELNWLLEQAEMQQTVRTEQSFLSTFEQNRQRFQSIIDRYLPSNSSVQFSVSRELTSIKKYQLIISCVVKEADEERARTTITTEVFGALGIALADEMRKVLECPDLSFLPDYSESVFKLPRKLQWPRKSKTDYTAMFHTFHFRVQ